MFEQEREEIEELLDGFEADQDPSGARLLRLPCGAELKIAFPEGTPNFYAEAEAMPLPVDACDATRCRALATLNFFWRDLEGFVVALRDGVLMVEGREDMARMADEVVFADWIRRADRAVCAVRLVATAPQAEDGGGDPQDPGTASGEREVRICP